MSDQRVSMFDILKTMSEENQDVRLAPLGNISYLRKVRAGTNITIGVAGDVVAAIGIHGRFVGGLILADKEQYRATEARLRRGQGEA
jgi:hypothetical protein